MSNSSSSVFIASTDMNVGFNALMGLDLIEFGPDGGRAQVHIDALVSRTRCGWHHQREGPPAEAMVMRTRSTS